MEISYRQGNELFELLCQNEFIRKIDKLYKSCEWSTAYQSTSFNKSWYRAYRNEYTPLVAYIEKGNNLTDFAWFAKKMIPTRLSSQEAIKQPTKCGCR